METQCCASVCAETECWRRCQRTERTIWISRSRRTFQHPTRVQTHIQWSLRSQGGARRVLCHASSEDYCCCTQTNKGSTPCEHPRPKHNTQEGQPRLAGIKAQRAFLKRYASPRKKLGKERVHRKEIFRSVHLTSEVLKLQNSRIDHRKKPPAEKHGICRKMSICSMTRTKARSSHLQKFGHF